MEYREISCVESVFERYVQLFQLCFPTADHFTVSYLKWLYLENPDGQAIGFDAWDGEQLAAHYVCIPIAGLLRGRVTSGILSLNTATHPHYQGRGLFTKLADATYRRAVELGCEFAYGVANANSTPGFVRKLDFQLVSPLEARIGVGGLFRDAEQFRSLERRASFRRAWSERAFDWRIANPSRPVAVSACGLGACFHVPTGKPMISAYWERYGDPRAHSDVGGAKAGINLFLGALPCERWPSRNYISIPTCLRPSPLNFIFRDFVGRHGVLASHELMISFLDWDAY